SERCRDARRIQRLAGGSAEMAGTYDVIISGASLAGSAAAVFFARRGARLALLDRHSDISAYKGPCTHYTQPCADPGLADLGVTDRLEAAGAVRNTADYWTRWGWITPARDAGPMPFGYNVRRQTLDPIVRQLAASTPGVDLLLGHRVTDLITDGE